MSGTAIEDRIRQLVAKMIAADGREVAWTADQGIDVMAKDLFMELHAIATRLQEIGSEMLEEAGQ